MKNIFLLLLAITAHAVTIPLYIETTTNTVVSPDAPTTLAGYGITDGGGLPTTPADGAFLVGDGADWVEESGGTARTSLGVAISSDVQAWDTQLDDIAALTPTDGNFIVGNGSTWVAESGNTAQVSMGVQGAVGGGQVGISASTNGASGGAVGSVAVSDSGGGAVGLAASALGGGGAVGRQASESGGGGCAVGAFAVATDGFAIGINASANGPGRGQLGEGTNGTNNTFQFRDSGSITAAEFGQLSADTTTTAISYTALVTDGAILASNASGATITLPAAASVPSNYRLSIKNIGASGSITVDGDGTETIDGGLTAVLTTLNESITLLTDGSNWFIK